MKNGPRPVFLFWTVFADQSARSFVTAAIAVAIDAAARLSGIADQGTGHTANSSADRCTAHVTSRRAADDSAGRSTDTGALFRLRAGGERKDEDGCEEDILHDWFLFDGRFKGNLGGRSDAAHQDEDEEDDHDQPEAT
jgi:hypothetical protein